MLQFEINKHLLKMNKEPKKTQMNPGLLLLRKVEFSFVDSGRVDKFFIRNEQFIHDDSSLVFFFFFHM